MGERINVNEFLHDAFFNLFKNIPSDNDSIIGDESDFNKKPTFNFIILNT